MEILHLEWEISEDSATGIVRYCPNCGAKAVFTDSLKKRRNANGKNIFEYAIYKCPKGHTWNRMVDTYKAQDYSENDGGYEESCVGNEECIEAVNISQCVLKGLVEIEILLVSVKGNWRLDKLLAQYIGDLSRSRIGEYIKEGRILVNGETAQPKTLVKTGQVIRIRLR